MQLLEANKVSTQPNQERHMVRRLLWNESIQAVKLSTEFSDFKSFRRELEQTLHYNSSYVRMRNTNSIIRWFFPSHSLDNLLTMTWTFYRNEGILKEFMRYQYLTIEPAVAEFVTQNILPMQPRELVTSDYLRDFLLKKYGVVRADPFESLRGACRDMGFIYSENKKLVICQIPTPKTSFLVLTHYLLAPSPRTLTIKEVLSNLFWQYLGIRKADDVRNILKEADANGFITKYIVADQLEQFTTRYSFDEFVQRRIQL
jgi:hypothetical protein